MKPTQSFEEQFPSLASMKGYIIENGDARLMNVIDLIEHVRYSKPILFSMRDIELNCLDKQRVRDAIEKSRDDICLCDEEENFHCLYCSVINEFYKELGL